MDEERQRLLEELYTQYAAWGSGWSRFKLRLGYWRKIWLWRLVISLSFLLKRFLDIAGALFGLLVFSPVFALIVLAVFLEDRGPVFFRQTRVGVHGRLFQMLKFRSMVPDADKLKDDLLEQNESDGALFKMRHDPRITKTGRIIRKLSLDELPQLWNVLKGEMSLVGPRPPVIREVQEYSVHDRGRLGIKPGITCFWQVSGRSELNFQQQVDLDLKYINSQSLKLDVLLLLKTIPAVILGKGAY